MTQLRHSFVGGPLRQVAAPRSADQDFSPGRARPPGATGDTGGVKTRVSPLFLALLGATVLGGVLATVDQPFARTTGIVLIVIGGWAASLCLHEFGHAITAYRGGDLSIPGKGYLTLDPVSYTHLTLPTNREV